MLAEPYSSADFQHGLVALVKGGFLITAVIPEDKTALEVTLFLHDLKLRKPELVVISPLKEVQELANKAFSIPEGIPE